MRIIKVCENENLEVISKKYKIPMLLIEKYNQISKDVSEGDRLIIPFSARAIHIVKPLETLSIIAKKYNTTIERLKKDNNLIAPLYIGEQLIIR